MILLAAIYEYTKARKGKKEEEKQEVSRFVYIDAASHVVSKVSSVTICYQSKPVKILQSKALPLLIQRLLLRR
jgi:hypothetical protein